MARAISAGTGLVFIEILGLCILFDVDALDFASLKNGPDDVFCLEVFNTDCFVKFINQRLVHG